jgi:hypothetical protein
MEREIEHKLSQALDYYKFAGALFFVKKYKLVNLHV